MDAVQRRAALSDYLSQAAGPVSASVLAARFSVSRQLIVGDIALLRAGGLDIAAPLCLEDGTGRPTAELDNAYFRTKETNA